MSLQTRFIIKKWTPEEAYKINSNGENTFLFAWTVNPEYDINNGVLNQLDDIADLYLDNNYKSYNYLIQQFNITISDSYFDWDDQEYTKKFGLNISYLINHSNNCSVQSPESPFEDLDNISISDDNIINNDMTDGYYSDTNSEATSNIIESDASPKCEIINLNLLKPSMFDNDEIVLNVTSGTIISIKGIPESDQKYLHNLSYEAYSLQFIKIYSKYHNYSSDNQTISDTVGYDNIDITTISFKRVTDFINESSPLIPAKKFRSISRIERYILDKMIKLDHIYEQKIKESNLKINNIPNVHINSKNIWNSEYLNKKHTDNFNNFEQIQDKTQLLNNEIDEFIQWKNKKQNIHKVNPSQISAVSKLV